MQNQKSKNIIVRKPLLMYFVFAFGFFWLMLVLELVLMLVILRLDMSAIPSWVFIGSSILGSWMPSLAAAVVTGVTEGRAAVGQLFAKFFKFKLPARWYLASILPVGITFAAVGLYRLFGGEPISGVNTAVSFWVMLFISTVFTGATGEEPGWRGFALPRMLQKYKPLTAGLLLGVIWGFWHLPLWLMDGMPMNELLPYVGAFLVSIISLTILMAWIYMRTSHSLVPMVLAHFTMNFALNLAVDGLGLAPQIPVFYIIAGLFAATALVVAAVGGLSPRKVVESAPAAA